MRIERLVLDNFQGIKHLEMSPNGSDVTIRGDNAVGKTTVANAITWLLFDKPLDGAKSFSPKPKDDSGEDVHHIETSVEMAVCGGSTFKKILSENWPKKRGNSKGTFSGHSTDYFVDDVPKKQVEYQKALDDLCLPTRMKVLMNPSYFSEEMTWQARRGILFDIHGELSDADVIAANDDLEPLAGMLLLPNGDAISVDELISKTKGQMKKWNKLLSDIPVRIDELSKNITENENPLPTKKYLSELKERKAELLRSLSQAEQSDADLANQQEINRLTRELLSAEAKDQTMFRELMEEWKNDYDTRKLALDNAEKTYRVGVTSLEDIRKQTLDNTKKRNALVAEFERISSLSYEGDGICPLCKQQLPSNQIEEAVRQFESEKLKQLCDIQNKGKECSESVIEDLMKTEEKIKSELDRIKESVSELKFQMDDIKGREPKFVLSDDVKAIKSKIDALENATTNDSKNLRINEINLKIGDVEALLVEANKVIDGHERNDAMRERIKVLENELHSASKEYEKCERTLYLCEQFITTKADAISEAVNESFTTVQFKLFDRQ
ncbi:MAG: AAA family ATPase, partial [Eubacterium sp.]